MNFSQGSLIGRFWYFLLALLLLSVGMVLEAHADGLSLDISYLKRPTLDEQTHEPEISLTSMLMERKVEFSLDRFEANEENRVSTQLTLVRTSNQRARSAHIGSVMAVLATFDEAHVLPAEHDPQANQLIHTLIQVQSAVMKSDNAEFRAWVSDASDRKFKDGAGSVLENVQDTGLTMAFLEALVDHSELSSPWDRPALVESFQVFNVQREDWVLLRKILLDARAQLAIHGVQLSDVFARRRPEMPGAVR